jgi:hypothetical protein
MPKGSRVTFAAPGFGPLNGVTFIQNGEQVQEEILIQSEYIMSRFGYRMLGVKLGPF